MYGSTKAARSGGSACMSSQLRMRQKRSMPSMCARVENAGIGSTIAPAASNAFAAATTASRTSASTARPQPASSCSPTLSALTPRSSAVHSIFW